MTIREIAALAGVSPAAVSLVINHKKGVGDETRRRIQGVMDEYGYSPAAPRRQAARFRLMVIKFRAHGIALEENQGFIASIIDRIDSFKRYKRVIEILGINGLFAESYLSMEELMKYADCGRRAVQNALDAADSENILTRTRDGHKYLYTILPSAWPDP